MHLFAVEHLGHVFVEFAEAVGQAVVELDVGLDFGFGRLDYAGEV